MNLGHSLSEAGLHRQTDTDNRVYLLLDAWYKNAAYSVSVNREEISSIRLDTPLPASPIGRVAGEQEEEEGWPYLARTRGG